MHDHIASRIIPLSILAIVVACDAPPRVGPEAFAVSVTHLEWVSRAGDEAETRTVIIENRGDDRIVIVPVLSSHDTRFALVDPPDELHLAWGERGEVRVRFTPTHAVPATGVLTFVAEGGMRHDVRLRADVLARADCRVVPHLPESDDQISPIPLVVIDVDGYSAPPPGPFMWSLVRMPDLRGPYLFSDENPYGLAVGLGSLAYDDVIPGGPSGHLNVVDKGALYTVRVRDEEGRGCETTFFADSNPFGNYPGRSVVLTWEGEADLDLHVSRIVDGRACFNGVHVVEEQRCSDDEALFDCSSRLCRDGDWNGDLYEWPYDFFVKPKRHPTGQGAELIYFPSAGSMGDARIAVEAIDVPGPVVFTMRVFHSRLAFQERVGVVFPGELRTIGEMWF